MRGALVQILLPVFLIATEPCVAARVVESRCPTIIGGDVVPPYYQETARAPRVLALREAPFPLPSEAGLAAAEAVSETAYRHFLDDMLYTHDGDDRRFGPEHDLAMANIESLFGTFGLTVTMEPFFHVGVSYNVVGTKLGTQYPDQEFIVGAHYDSVGNPGADDDASGVALLLEVARVLTFSEPAYTIRFVAFDKEEEGLIGAEAYVNSHIDDDILAMISLDMVAWDNGDNRAVIRGDDTAAALRSNLEDAVISYGDGLGATVLDTLAASDFVMFVLAGFPACMVSEVITGNPHLHTALDSVDTPGYIDYAYATRFTRSIVGFLVDHAEVSVMLPEVTAPDPEPAGSEKNRYISIVIPPPTVEGTGQETAIRVRLASLHHSVAPPPGTPDFSAWEGEYRWVNSLSEDHICPDSPTFGNTFRCAVLGCLPEYRDWAGELGGEVLHVTGASVVPSSTYDIVRFPPECQDNEWNCALFVSNELPVSTARFGNVDDDLQLNVLDSAEVVDHLKGVPGSLSKSRVHLGANVPDAMGDNVTVLDVAMVVDALKDRPYGFAGDFGPCTDACPYETPCQ